MANTSSSTMSRDLTPYFLFLLASATIGPLLFGYHLAELNAPQEVLTCVKSNVAPYTVGRLVSGWSKSSRDVAYTKSYSTLPQCIPMDATQFGLVSSFFTLGGLVGALGGGPVTSAYGRLRAMIIASLFAAVGPFLEALSPNIGTLTVGRFISGVGAGAATVIVPIYISEIAPPGQKGFWGTFTQVMINFGILITQFMGLFLSKGQLWRVILGTGGAIALVQTVTLVLGGTESPKYLADNGKPTRAKMVLRAIRGHEANIDEEVEGWGIEHAGDLHEEEETLLRAEENPSSDTEHPSNKANLKHMGKQALSVITVLRHEESRPAVLAVVMIMTAQQLLGINSIVMYGVSLLSDLLAANSAVLNVGVAALNILVTIAAAPLVDKLGRKTCLLSSMSGMGLSSLLLGVGIMKHIPILSAVAVILFVASFGLGLGPVPFILSSELVGAEAVGATQSWALAANWIATFVVAQFFPILNAKMGRGQIYFIFFGFAVLFTWYVLNFPRPPFPLKMLFSACSMIESMSPLTFAH
nr:putative metabolite transport protein [Quercus suber]